jgi:hypothetical protein
MYSSLILLCQRCQGVVHEASATRTDNLVVVVRVRGSGGSSVPGCKWGCPKSQKRNLHLYHVARLFIQPMHLYVNPYQVWSNFNSYRSECLYRNILTVCLIRWRKISITREIQPDMTKKHGYRGRWAVRNLGGATSWSSTTFSQTCPASPPP